MLAYILRRLAYAVPIVLGVNIITFVLFFMVNPPEHQARKALGGKNVTPEKIQSYLHEKGYDLPRFYNSDEEGTTALTKTIFYQKFVNLLRFDFGNADATGERIGEAVRRRIGPSLAITVPTMLLGVLAGLFLAMIVAYYRGTYLDVWGMVVCVLLMSVVILYYIIGLQYYIGRAWRLTPISGWGLGWDNWRFVLGPVIMTLVAGLGGSVRFYRTIFLEELNRDYIRTARSKGLSEFRVLYGHGLRNAMIPVLTSVVASLPFLITGSLILENFFGIPGLGSYTIDALHANDFAVVRSMVYLGSVLYIAGLILTDISYALVDPRITFTTGGRTQGRMWTVYVGVIAMIGVLLLVGHLTDPQRRDLPSSKEKMNGAQAAVTPEEQARKRAVAREEERFWQNAGIAASNALAVSVLVVGLLGWGVARRREYWCNAWRQIRRRPLAMVSLGVLSLFAVVAFVDSIAWRDAARGPDNQIVRDKAGSIQYEHSPKSLLDRAWVLGWCQFVPIPKDKQGKPLVIREVTATAEKTYSEPLAEVTFQLMTDPDTGERRPEQLTFPGAHLLGTDEAGMDVLYRCLKGVRTGLIIGLVTTLIALPFAMFFGIMAGYYGGWVDDLIQYMYTTLSSIPGVLLIMGFILVFGQGLWQVCVILGITGWVGLCRLLRGESLKLRTSDYVQAGRALGVSDLRIMWQHLMPNLMHIVLIRVVLSFSGLVGAEAMLTYIGIGVGPETGSWGNMINAARMELARDPVIWWSITGSFVFMVLLVLCANLLGDAIRDALDPKLRTE